MKLFYCKLITIINILFSCFLKIHCQACVFKHSDGSELQEDDTEGGFNLEKIKDTSPVNTNVLKLFVENVKSIQSKTASSTSQLFFIEPNLTSELFELKLTDDFLKYKEYETEDVISLTITFECITGKSRIIAKKPDTGASKIVITKSLNDSMINSDSNCDNFDTTLIIIILVVLLVIVSIVLVVSIIRNMRHQKNPVVKKTHDVNESKPEMTEVARPSSSSNNSQPRRSVTFVDEIKEINIARL